MFRNVFHALFYWAPTLVVCLAVAARAAAPYPYDPKDSAPVLIESMSVISSELADKSALYVRVDGADPNADFLSELNSRKLQPIFAPWSARSAEHDRCRTAGNGAAVVGACMHDNFLWAEMLSMPLWHVALVRVKTAACTAELTLLQGAAQWHVVSQRSICT
jgi:hypothetical protein